MVAEIRGSVLRLRANRGLLFTMLLAMMLTGGLLWDLVAQSVAPHVSAEEVRAYDARHVWLSAFGSWAGVLTAVLASASLVGAWWQWGSLPMAVMLQPQRSRFILVEFFGVVASVIVILLGSLGIWTAGWALSQSILGFDGGWSSPTEFAVALAKAALVTMSYAGLATAFVVVFRSQLWGVVATVGAVVVDWMAPAKWRGLRILSPSQQVASLVGVRIDRPPFMSDRLWVEAITVEVRALPDAGPLDAERIVQLTPIPTWRAVLVLAAWCVVSLVVAHVVLLRRDVS